MRRALRMFGVAIVLAVAGLTLGAGAASAAPVPAAVTAAAPTPAPPPVDRPCDKEITASCDPAPPGAECKAAPDVESPLDGVTGEILGAPYSAPQGKDPSMWERYGFAGLKWEGYDLGVTPPLIGGCWPNGESVNASMGSQIANMLFSTAKSIVAVSDSLLHSAYATEWLQVFDPYITEAVTSLRDKVFTGWVPLAAAALGVVLLFQARKMAFATTASTVGAALFVLTAATFVFTNPLWTAHTADNALTGMTADTASAINGSAPSTNPGSGQAVPDADHALIASVHDALLYQPWVQGEFGSADSPTAKKYAAQLFDSQALTWPEAQVARKGGKPATDLINAKKAKFIAIVDKIKTEDPLAYSFIQGKRSTDRINFAFMALLGALLSMPIIITASLAMMCAFLIIRLAVIVAPVVAPVALVVASVGTNLVDRVVSISLTALVWSIGLPITMLLDRAVLTAPGLNPWIRLVLLGLIAAASFIFLVGMAPGFGGVLNKKYGRKGHKWFGRGLTMAAAWWGAHTGRDDSEPEPRERKERPIDAEIEDDASPYGDDLPEDDTIDVDWWDHKEDAVPITATGEPIDPDDVVQPSSAADRGLPKPQKPEPEAADGARDAEVRYEDEDDNVVYDLWSGRSRADWVDERESGDARRGDVGDEPAAIEDGVDRSWETRGGARWSPDDDGSGDDDRPSVGAGSRGEE
jgi:hypothetical protein